MEFSLCERGRLFITDPAIEHLRGGGPKGRLTYQQASPVFSLNLYLTAYKAMACQVRTYSVFTLLILASYRLGAQGQVSAPAPDFLYAPPFALPPGTVVIGDPGPTSAPDFQPPASTPPFALLPGTVTEIDPAPSVAPYVQPPVSTPFPVPPGAVIIIDPGPSTEPDFQPPIAVPTFVPSPGIAELVSAPVPDIAPPNSSPSPVLGTTPPSESSSGATAPEPPGTNAAQMKGPMVWTSLLASVFFAVLQYVGG